MNFHMIFWLIKYYQNQNLPLSLYHQNNKMYDFQYQFLLVLHYSPYLYNLLLIIFLKFLICDVMWP